MSEVNIRGIMDQLNSISEKVKGGDIYEIDTQVNLLERIISRFFENSSYYKLVCDAKREARSAVNIGDDKQGYAKIWVGQQVDSIISNMKIELENFGVPYKGDSKLIKQDKSITIHNNPTFSQSQSVNITLLKEILKDSLTGKQFKELAEIANEEKDVEKAVPKLIDKMKSFGSDVLSNVIANIITNPSVYTSLFNLT